MQAMVKDLEACASWPRSRCISAAAWVLFFPSGASSEYMCGVLVQRCSRLLMNSADRLFVPRLADERAVLIAAATCLHRAAVLGNEPVWAGVADAARVLLQSDDSEKLDHGFGLPVLLSRSAVNRGYVVTRLLEARAHRGGRRARLGRLLSARLRLDLDGQTRRKCQLRRPLAEEPRPFGGI